LVKTLPVARSRYFRDPELRAAEVTAFEVWHLEAEPLVKELFWAEFVAQSRPMVVRDGLRHWAPDWRRSFPAALRAAKDPVPLSIWPDGQDQLSEGIVRRHARALLPLDQALEQIVRAPCDGRRASLSVRDRHAAWGCAVEGASLPKPKPLAKRGKPTQTDTQTDTQTQTQTRTQTQTTLAAHLASLEPP
jgi:hypothetical protein